MHNISSLLFQIKICSLLDDILIQRSKQTPRVALSSARFNWVSGKNCPRLPALDKMCGLLVSAASGLLTQRGSLRFPSFLSSFLCFFLSKAGSEQNLRLSCCARSWPQTLRWPLALSTSSCGGGGTWAFTRGFWAVMAPAWVDSTFSMPWSGRSAG